MKLPRVRLTVRGMLVVVAFAALVLSAAEWMPPSPMVAGFARGWHHGARNRESSARCRAFEVQRFVVGRFGLLVRIGVNLPVAVLIVLCCQVLIGVSESSLGDGLLVDQRRIDSTRGILSR